MDKTRQISIDLNPDQASLIDGAVRSGEYASADAVLREALLMWEFLREEAPGELQKIGMLWDEGLASGSAEDGEDAFRTIRAELEQEISRKVL